MNEWKRLSLPERLLQRIDEYRGNLSRAEFIELCINHMANQRADGEMRSPYATREELKELERSLKNIIKNFMEFFLCFKLELEPDEGKRGELQHLMDETVPLEETNQTGEEQGKDIPPEDRNDFLSLFLWLPAILLFGFGDTMTSVLVFSRGGFEANPLFQTLLRLAGGSIFSFILIKTLVLVGLAVISYYLVPRQKWLIPAILSMVGMFLVGHNLVSLVNL